MFMKLRLKAALRTVCAATLILAAGAAQATDLVVSAAASLTNAFKELAQSFEQQHPGVKVITNFGASDILMQQIVRGAPADVFASADQTAMDKAVAEKAVDAASRQNFAANQIVLIVPHDAKQLPTSLANLTRAQYQRIALGNPASVPFGRYTKAALEQAGLWPQVQAKAVMAENVRTSLDYVARGEVDAGFVFATDAAVMPEKVKVALRIPSDTPATYPIAVTSGSRQPALAAQFVAYVRSSSGQAVLARYGFLKP
ncbi:molybdate ABC transporter substrate-binding protein [Herbaspirillum rubrisubalbicans]|uniref:Molybdate ABC transporter substrate-binding protein n=1 Tax=Herbaspirillum rubrisubalbicans TaxID=80842 RepID=A0AAD0U6Y1_9BURK|nr:molybdate ABC transporter substrate-binding protein [Herbaspirillum rubrisubalbicans]AYR24209.1 molybdate ABC transporter substrate-binding protein [Herbaspirillum rubrisubalbicans]